MRPSLGSIIDLKKHLSLGLSFKPSADIIFQTGGLVPTVNEKTQLPGLSFSDSTSRYTVSLPQELNFSMSARLDNPTKTTVTGGFTYLDWENHDTQTVNHTLVDTVNFKYQSTIGISFGVEHWILNKTPFRFGFIYSESPFGSEFEITKVSIGSGWVYDNISVDVAAIFGSVEYMYNDLFVPQGQSSSALERVNESNAVLKATIKYSF
jgi:long-subunit fatty acid transport protein